MENAKYIVISLVLLAIVLGVVVWQFGDRLRPYTILSVTQFTVEQTGKVGADNRWSGSFWNILAMNDVAGSQVSLLRFDKDLVEQHGANWILENKVEPTAQIDITMTALQPYYELPTVLREYIVYPKVYSTYCNSWGTSSGLEWKSTKVTVPELRARVYQFAPQDTGGWTLHTPFTVEVKKVTGENTFTLTQTVDTLGGQQTIVIANPKDSTEQVMIKDLGKIKQGQEIPPYNHIVIFDQHYAFTYSPQLIKDISYDTSQTTGEKLNDYSYSQYWFGGGNVYLESAEGPDHLGRWSDDQSPAFWLKEHSAYFITDEDYPGVEFLNDNGKWYYTPVAADIFNDNPNTYSAKHSGIGKSLVNYLRDVRNNALQNLDTFGQGVVLGADGKLRVNLPYGAASSVVQIRVSTELADAVVVKETVTDPEITKAVWLSNKKADVTISDHDIAVITVKQQAEVTGAVYVRATLSPEGVPALLDHTQLQKQMAYNEEYEFKFVLTNNNPGTGNVKGKVVFEALNVNGEVCSTKELSFTLTPKGAVTTLTVITVDRQTKLYVSGIPVSVAYGTESKSAYTSGGTASFDLGSYVGTVTVTAENSTLYQGAVSSIVVQAGPNTVTLELLKHGETIPWWELYWWLIVIIVVAVVAIAVAVWWWKTR